jgi:crotonobetainyl-CoA:carnitine CoA-transferase CaiB-like acyl-CoA transferase
VEETLNYPHLRERGTVRTIHDPVYDGELDVPGFPLKFSEFPEELPLQAPTLGQHNVEILTKYLGRAPEDIHRLQDDGVLIERRR